MMETDDINEVVTDSPCVICTQPYCQSETLKSQANLTVPLCNKLFRLYYSEFVSAGDKECPSIPVFDFTKECLPFCLSCRRELLQGVKFCERIQSIEQQLEEGMSTLRKRAVDSWAKPNPEEHWPDRNIGALKQKNFGSTSDETLIGDKNITNVPESESVNRIASTTSGDTIASNPPSKLLNDETPINENMLQASPEPVILTLDLTGDDETTESDPEVLMEYDEFSELSEAGNISGIGNETHVHQHHYHYYFSGKPGNNEEGVQMMHPSDYVDVVLDEESPEEIPIPPVLPPPEVYQNPKPKMVQTSVSVQKTRSGSGKKIVGNGNKRKRTKRRYTFNCRDCGNVFRSYAGLMVHARVHWGQNCSLCKQHCRTQAEMEDHWVTVHGMKMEKKVQVSYPENPEDLYQFDETETSNTFHSINGNEFNGISIPTSHMEVPDNQLPEFKYFEGQQSNEGLASAHFTQNHSQTNNPKPNPASDLVTKLNVQNGEKPKPAFECMTCKKTYYRKKNLENHITQRHPGVQKQCYPAVQKKPHLTVQKRRRNTGEFPCEHCEKAFSYANNRRRHITQIHGNIGRQRQSV